MNVQSQVAIVYGVKAGLGGLGLHAATVLAGLSLGEGVIHAFGPGRADVWPLAGAVPTVYGHDSPQFIPPWATRYTWLRWYQGQLQFQHDSRLGSWAAVEVERLRPQQCYVFTQVGLETLRLAKRAGIPTALDNPNGHIRHYSDICQKESLHWCGHKYRLHPSPAMVERVEEEYHLADRIRVSSEWAKASMVARGVPARKIHVIPLTLNLEKFSPPLGRVAPDGPLRVCYVGSLSLHKGFIYLLQAIRMLGDGRVSLHVVGATGDRCCRQLLARERMGLMIDCAAGDPLPTYQRAEVFVLPTLHDGFGYVVAEAMACGLPAIVTESCGAASLVRPDETGWVVPAGQAEELAGALEGALYRRKDLPLMGRMARANVERQAGLGCLIALSDWFYNN